MGRDVIEIFTFIGSIALISMLVYRYQGTVAIVKQVGETYSGLLQTATFQNPVSNGFAS
jgi:hypothetical protein